MDNRIDINNKIKKENKNKRTVLKVFPIPAFCLVCLGVLSLIIHIISYISTSFADFFNENISSVTRMIFAKITGVFPFSIGETVVICAPVCAILILVFYFRKIVDEPEKPKRFIAGVFSILTLFYSLFVINFGTGYRNSSIDKKLGIEKHNITATELYNTVISVSNDLSSLLDEIEFENSEASSIMPYTFDTMTEKINKAYDTVCDKYNFISRFHSEIKIIALSDIMTYTHVSGVYSYYTGESNLNINFPDYTLVYTTAHEFAHQRGIAREDEANFVAFLVCTASDDAYIKYCGYQNMLEYLLNALYTADKEMYVDAVSCLPYKSRVEMIAFNNFFDRYDDSVASKVSSTVNDVYLHSQGVSEGEKSYGMVVDLCVAYYENSSESNFR